MIILVILYREDCTVPFEYNFQDFTEAGANAYGGKLQGWHGKIQREGGGWGQPYNS